MIEKITQNYVSPILCQQDLTNLTSRKDKDGKDNMSIKVLIQSREVFVTYSLEESKMELTISLPSNYTLGAIKIESTKHIAGKLQAREIVKQLSIYLTSDSSERATIRRNFVVEEKLGPEVRRSRGMLRLLLGHSVCRFNLLN